MRKALVALMAGVVVACGGGAVNQQASGPRLLTYQQLAARPLKLPAVKSGQACPANPITLEGGTAPRIGMHIPLGFGTVGPQGGYAWKKTVWELPPSSSLPIGLLRGGRRDGSGMLYFDGLAIGPSDAKEITVVDSRGGQTPSFSELRLPQRGPDRQPAQRLEGRLDRAPPGDQHGVHVPEGEGMNFAPSGTRQQRCLLRLSDHGGLSRDSGGL
jgi:hypothetical protein